MRQKIVAYHLLQAFEQDLAGKVMLYLANGWELQGGAQPMQVQGWFAQTLVKYEPA